jgi:hypothetical protein
MHILDQNWAATIALAATITRQLPPLLAAIEAGRRMRMSSWSVPTSSCSWRTPTLSHHWRPRLEEPPWAATAVHRVICCLRWAPPWSPLCFANFSVAFGAPERPGCHAPTRRPLSYGAIGFPLSRRSRTRQSRPPPSIRRSMAEIRTRGYPFAF